MDITIPSISTSTEHYRALVSNCCHAARLNIATLVALIPSFHCFPGCLRDRPRGLQNGQRSADPSYDRVCACLDMIVAVTVARPSRLVLSIALLPGHFPSYRSKGSVYRCALSHSLRQMLPSFLCMIPCVVLCL